ncbi:MAG: hypothetical protein IJO43_02095 [Bacilli bacterium]|nr:hypothetical protein [Bacilli bacterium]
MKFIKKNIRLTVAVIIALGLILAGVVLLFINDDNQKKNPDVPVKEETREEQMVEATGMTKEQAIEIVKENFGSDNYEFTAEATNDGFYKVTAKNTVEDTETVYYVDPTNGSYYVDLETK